MFTFILGSYVAYFKNPMLVYVYNHDNGKFEFKHTYISCRFSCDFTEYMHAT